MVWIHLLVCFYIFQLEKGLGPEGILLVNKTNPLTLWYSDNLTAEVFGNALEDPLLADGIGAHKDGHLLVLLQQVVDLDKQVEMIGNIQVDVSGAKASTLRYITVLWKSSNSLSLLKFFNPLFLTSYSNKQTLVLSL